MTKTVPEFQEGCSHLVALAGFPKSGNTLINETLNNAGKVVEPSWIPPKYEYQSPKDLEQFAAGPIVFNPFLGTNRCHVKTHLACSDNNYIDSNRNILIERIVLIIRNPFDTLLSATNYLRYSVNLNKRLTANQVATLKHFYPDLTETDVENPDIFNLKKLSERGALDKALEIFSASGTCIPQFLARSGTWLDFYSSFDQAKKPLMRIRFEDIVDSSDKYLSVSTEIGSFLDCNPDILAQAFDLQNQACQIAKKANNLFFPIAKSNYFQQYFEPRTLRRFCNQYGTQLSKNGYSDLVDTIMSA